jgi:hypothetical protein
VAWYYEDGTGLSHGSSHTKTIASSGTYFARCITTTGEILSSRSNYITITVHQIPDNTPILASYLPIVAGNYVTLNAGNCFPNNYEWENIGTIQNVNVLPLVTTTYRAFCKNQTCRGDVRSVQITVLQPTIRANDSEICYNSYTDSRNSVVLTIVNCDGLITWSTRQTSSTISVQSHQTTTFTANCKSPDNITVSTNAVTIYVTPKPTITKITLNRLAYRLAATCSVGNTFLWSTGATVPLLFLLMLHKNIPHIAKKMAAQVSEQRKIFMPPHLFPPI